MQPLRWELRALSDPRYLDTAIARLGWTLEALRDAEVETARALVAGLQGEWEHLRERYAWRVRCKGAGS
ncbi:MAG: hypothetical protein ACRDZO_20060 [Egibacteraceae bacterium]